MRSLKRAFYDPSDSASVPPALAEARTIIREILPEEPWKASSVMFSLHDAIQKFQSSSSMLIKADFDKVFLSNRFIGKRFGAAAFRLIEQCDNSSQPSLASINSRAADYFKMDGRDRAALMVASVLGSVDTGFPYHNAGHNRKVVMQAMRLTAAAAELSSRDVAKLLVAASIHDLGHNGKGNVENGVHKPFLLEKQAFEHARPYLAQAGLTPDELEDIKTLVLATDVSPLGSKDSPSYIFATSPQEVPPELARLNLSKPLAKSARILQVADIASSAALCCEQSRKECAAIAREMNFGENYNKEASFRFFMNACEPIMQALPETKKVYGDNPAHIYENIYNDRGKKSPPELSFRQI